MCRAPEERDTWLEGESVQLATGTHFLESHHSGGKISSLERKYQAIRFQSQLNLEVPHSQKSSDFSSFLLRKGHGLSDLQVREQRSRAGEQKGKFATRILLALLEGAAI